MAKMVSERADLLPAMAEVFREHGFEGASIALISEKTGLGKGSLYHFFPGGKEEMAGAVLGEIGAWFTTHVFAPLQWDTDAAAAIDRMFRAVIEYFDSGRRVCLVGAFALATSRDRFAKQVRSYFRMWKEALATALVRLGRDKPAAELMAEEVLAVIQGSLVLARALDDRTVFARSMSRVKRVLLGHQR
ncbi:MAG: TetR/AcrR family transcriptional regulator [Verrucomicrobia bacterium]|nr:TetR/AcrR family transcriptional regulator [Verrucomicrobiota bacterium]